MVWWPGRQRSIPAPNPPQASLALVVTVAGVAGGGCRLFEAVRVGVDRTGCRTLEGIAVAGTDGEAFARKLGAEVGDELTHDVLRFAEIDLAQLGALRPLPTGYDLARWTGSAPERLVDSYAQAKWWVRDAPNRHPPIVPDWNTDLIRAGERERARRGARVWVEAAVMTGTDTVVAFSEIETSDTRADASQPDTVVLPAHHKSRLATSLRAGLILRLAAARPDISSIEVTYALANAGIQAVNHRLGFRQARRRTSTVCPSDRVGVTGCSRGVAHGLLLGFGWSRSGRARLCRPRAAPQADRPTGRKVPRCPGAGSVASRISAGSGPGSGEPLTARTLLPGRYGGLDGEVAGGESERAAGAHDVCSAFQPVTDLGANRRKSMLRLAVWTGGRKDGPVSRPGGRHQGWQLGPRRRTGS